MIGIGKLNFPLVTLRVALGVLSIFTVGAPFLLLLLAPKLWPDFIAGLKFLNSPQGGSQTFAIVFAVTWFVLNSLSASLFALSLLVKKASRTILIVSGPWSAAMVLTGFAAMALYVLFVRFVDGRNDWVVGVVFGGLAVAALTGWWLLRRWPPYREVMMDRPPSWVDLGILICGGYIAVLAGFAYLMAFFRAG